MAKTKRNHFNGNDSDVPSDRGRGRGRGHGRGAPRGSPRGNLKGPTGGDIGGMGIRGNSRGKPLGGRSVYHSMADIDIDLQQWASSGNNSPSGRGSRGRHSSNRGANTPERGTLSTSSRGGRGRGRGNGSRSHLSHDASLSRLLYNDRPLLQPIKFVRSEHTATLFEEAEDIFEPVVESATPREESHIPTANKVARVFSGHGQSSLFNELQLSDDEDIQEVNLEDLGLVREKLEEQVKNERSRQPGVMEVEQQFTDFHINVKSLVAAENPDPTPPSAGVVSKETGVAPLDAHSLSLALTDDVIITTGDISDEHEAGSSALDKKKKSIGDKNTPVELEKWTEPMTTSNGTEWGELWSNIEQNQDNTSPPIEPSLDKALSDIIIDDANAVVDNGEGSPVFFVDVQPSLHNHQDAVPLISVSSTVPLGVQPDDGDDIIVYEAPNPRSGRVTPYPQAPVLVPIKSPLPSLAEMTFSTPPRTSSARKINPLRRGTLFERVSRKGKGKRGRRALSGLSSFGTFGALVAEARLRQDTEDSDDPRNDERRKGDSDLDWGNEDEDETKVKAVAEGMDLDPDLVGTGISMGAMKSFVNGVSGEGSQFVTMDDLEDIQKSKAEGASDSGDSNDSDDELISDEEMMLVADLEDGSGSDDEDFEDDDDSNSMEEYSPGRGFQARLDRLRKRQQRDIDLVEDDAEEIAPDFKWINESQAEYISDVEEFIEVNNARINNRNRQIHNEVFRSIRDGYFDEMKPVSSSSRYENLPPELREQWKKDRANKSEKKRERELARLVDSLDPLAPKKGGKKSRKATIAAAKLDPLIEVPHRIFDASSLEQQIRRFIFTSSKQTMALPPTNKETRKRIHLLGGAFNLKTKSQNSANGRYTTLIKTKHSGLNINEKKIAGIMKSLKTRAVYEGTDFKGKSREKDVSSVKIREGEVVGHTAPKIDASNVGFRMLASMGWTDGDGIGLSGGLDAPIAAVIKKTKLGLGASKS